MKTLLKLFLFFCICLETDMMGMLLEEEKPKDIEVITYGGQKISIPSALIEYFPSLNDIVIQENSEIVIQENSESKIVFSETPFVTKNSLEALLDMCKNLASKASSNNNNASSNNKLFASLTDEASSNNKLFASLTDDEVIILCKKALRQRFSENENKYNTNDLWSTIHIANFLSMDKRVITAAIEFLNEVDLNAINPEDIINQTVIQCPTTLFNNKLPLYKKLTFKKDTERISTNVCFNPENNECIFIKQTDVQLHNEKKQSKKDIKTEICITQFIKDKTNTESIYIPTEKKEEYSNEVPFDVNNHNNTIACTIDKNILIYTTDPLILSRKFSMNEKANSYWKVKFSPNGKWLGVKKDDNIEIYKTNPYELKQTISTYMRSFNFSSDGSRIVCSNSYGELVVYTLDDNSLFQMTKKYDLKMGIDESLLVDNDTYIYCKTINDWNIAINYQNDEQKSLPFFPFITYDSIQNTVAYARAYNSIKLAPIDTLINNLGEKNLVTTDIKNYDNFIFSSDGNYLIKVNSMGRKEDPSIEIYHVPVFDYTAEKLNSQQRWFVFFCNYWQKNDMPIPSQYNELYKNLSDPLKIKFRNLLEEVREVRKKRIEQENLKYTINRKEKRREPFIQQEIARRNKLAEDKKKHATFWKKMTQSGRASQNRLKNYVLHSY